MIQLHTAKKYIVEYEAVVSPGYDAPEVYFNIIANIYDCDCSAEDIYTEEYEVYRADLQRMYDSLTQRDNKYQRNKNRIEYELSMIDMTEQEFIESIKKVLELSDQNNEFILISWF